MGLPNCYRCGSWPCTCKCTIHHGSCLEILPMLPEQSVQTCVTSPPYWGLRDYGVDDQLGLESTPEEYVAKMVEVFRGVKRVLRDDGTVWLNLGDSYCSTDKWGGGKSGNTGKHTTNGDDVPSWAVRQKKASIDGIKPKDLCGIPWMVAFALRADGWYLRQDIIWHKPNPMPESVTDRCTKAHEYIFLLSKSAKYYCDMDAIKELATYAGCDRGGSTSRYEQNAAGMDNRQYDTRNRRSVWTVATQPFTGWTQTSHLARVEQGVPGGDIRHTMSEDCPVHGCRDRQCDEHGGDLPIHTEHNNSHPAQELSGNNLCDCDHREKPQSGNSLDLPDPSHVPTATPHSTQTSKRDHVPGTSPPCTPCEETSARTGHTLIPPESKGHCPDTPENNTSAGGCGGSPNNQSPSHNADSDKQSVSFEALDIPSLREMGCTCAFYQNQTKKTRHFATFPPKLIEPCILAGCPEGGVVLDPFHGAGTTAMVAQSNNRKYVGIELNEEYIKMSLNRLRQEVLF